MLPCNNRNIKKKYSHPIWPEEEIIQEDSPTYSSENSDIESECIAKDGLKPKYGFCRNVYYVNPPKSQNPYYKKWPDTPEKEESAQDIKLFLREEGTQTSPFKVSYSKPIDGHVGINISFSGINDKLSDKKESPTKFQGTSSNEYTHKVDTKSIPNITPTMCPTLGPIQCDYLDKGDNFNDDLLDFYNSFKEMIEKPYFAKEYVKKCQTEEPIDSNQPIKTKYELIQNNSKSSSALILRAGKKSEECDGIFIPEESIHLNRSVKPKCLNIDRTNVNIYAPIPNGSNSSLIQIFKAECDEIITPKESMDSDQLPTSKCFEKIQTNDCSFFPAPNDFKDTSAQTFKTKNDSQVCSGIIIPKDSINSNKSIKLKYLKKDQANVNSPLPNSNGTISPLIQLIKEEYDSDENEEIIAPTNLMHSGQSVRAKCYEKNQTGFNCPPVQAVKTENTSEICVEIIMPDKSKHLKQSSKSFRKYQREMIDEFNNLGRNYKVRSKSKKRQSAIKKKNSPVKQISPKLDKNSPVKEIMNSYFKRKIRSTRNKMLHPNSLFCSPRFDDNKSKSVNCKKEVHKFKPLESYGSSFSNNLDFNRYSNSKILLGNKRDLIPILNNIRLENKVFDTQKDQLPKSVKPTSKANRIKSKQSPLYKKSSPANRDRIIKELLYPNEII